MALATAAALASAAIAAGGLGYGIVQGEQQRKEAKSARGDQEAAQQQAVSEAASERRRSQIEANAANRKKVDITQALAASERRKSGQGTDLTGGGVAPGSVGLGTNVRLGG